MNIAIGQNNEAFANANDIIFYEGQAARTINILTKGKADIYILPCETPEGINEEDILKKSCRIARVEGPIILGAQDLFLSCRDSFSCVAAEQSSFYIADASSVAQIKRLFAIKKDYGAFMIESLAQTILSLHHSLSKLERFLKKLDSISGNLAVFFWAAKERYGFSRAPAAAFFREGLDNLQKMAEKGYQLPSVFSQEFIEEDHSDILEEDYIPPAEISEERIEYYRRLLNIPVEVRKAFYGSDAFVAARHCNLASELLEEIQSGIRGALSSAGKILNHVYVEDQECIFKEYIEAANEVKKSSQDPYVLLQALDYIIRKMRQIALFYEREYLHRIDMDVDYMENMYSLAKKPPESASPGTAGGFGDDLEVTGGNEGIPDELRDSADKILRYSNIPRERADMFRRNLEAFRRLKDKLSSDEYARSIRNAAVPLFFEVYNAVYKKVAEERNDSRLFNMFLMFGYMDETLLKPENVLALYRMANKSFDRGSCPVYNMREWLDKIYRMEKDPSINEFGQDYFDVFRESHKGRAVSEKEKNDYESDTGGRLKHEIDNMLKTNQKLCNGHISLYFPILHDDMITRDISRSFVTPGMVNESVKKILDIDFSAFHREVSYRNPEKGIEKEFIMKPVAPDIILIPTYGSRAMMWQEISGRDRNTPGRFMIPIFTDENLDDLMLRLVGNFRWEICKTVMGVAWSDITEKSLTSEYSDYVQFYKKNRDLSEEAKEKLKIQIAKYNGRIRDIFTTDYETWINFESKGIIRLNKVVRAIMYKYCPLSKPLRKGLEKQPMFNEVAARFNIERAKLARHIENNYARMVRNGIALDPELEENLRFYKEM